MGIWNWLAGRKEKPAGERSMKEMVEMLSETPEERHQDTILAVIMKGW